MFHSASLTGRPTQDNTLCALPAGLINMCCKDSRAGYFSWDSSSGEPVDTSVFVSLKSRGLGAT